MVDTNTDTGVKKDYLYYTLSYSQEVFEVMVFYVIYTIVSIDAKLDLKRGLIVACVVGLFSVFLEEYNPKIRENLRGGMFATIGATVIKH